MVTDAAFRHVLGHFATGVTVVTGCDAAGVPRGFTANALTSLSLNPPLVLVCVDKRSHTYPALMESNAAFAINILSRYQESISRLFASKRPDKFEATPYRVGKLGVPVLEHTLAYLECRVVERHTGGDHVILVASVQHLGTGGSGARPLLHYRGEYRSLVLDHCPQGAEASHASGALALQQESASSSVEGIVARGRSAPEGPRPCP